jgi:Fe-S cluster assembly ATP-binding protein
MLLEVKNVSFRYDRNEPFILENVTLTVDRGERLALFAPSGFGKTTLVKLMSGYLEPTEGQILLDGEDITNLSITERARRGISFAFQQPVRFKGITVKDLITLAAGRKIGVSEACEYLSEVGLCARDYINREVNGSLSGGELKRIEIATVLARGTKLSLFDEPEAGIDLWSFNNLIKVFENLYEKKGGSIFIISHQERILNIADKIVVVAGGEIAQIGKKDEVLPALLGKAAAACPTLSDKVI